MSSRTPKTQILFLGTAHHSLLTAYTHDHTQSHGRLLNTFWFIQRASQRKSGFGEKKKFCHQELVSIANSTELLFAWRVTWNQFLLISAGIKTRNKPSKRKKKGGLGEQHCGTVSYAVHCNASSNSHRHRFMCQLLPLLAQLHNSPWKAGKWGPSSWTPASMCGRPR